MLMMIMCAMWQGCEDTLLRDTDSASHPHHYLHLTHMITLHLLFATYCVWNTSCFEGFFLVAKPISEKRYKVEPQNARPA